MGSGRHIGRRLRMEGGRRRSLLEAWRRLEAPLSSTLSCMLPLPKRRCSSAVVVSQCKHHHRGMQQNLGKLPRTLRSSTRVAAWRVLTIHHMDNTYQKTTLIISFLHGLLHLTTHQPWTCSFKLGPFEIPVTDNGCILTIGSEATTFATYGGRYRITEACERARITTHASLLWLAVFKVQSVH